MKKKIQINRTFKQNNQLLSMYSQTSMIFSVLSFSNEEEEVEEITIKINLLSDHLGHTKPNQSKSSVNYLLSMNKRRITCK